jgi:hypothetical protein
MGYYEARRTSGEEVGAETAEGEGLMANGKKGQEKSLLGRLFSAETMIFVVGVGCVIYGVAEGVKIMQIFFGICIIGGSVALHFVRKKDWDAHWAELDRVRQAHERRMAEEREERK